MNLSLSEDDGDVAEALLDARRAAHRAGAPAAQIFVRRFVDEGRLDEKRVEVDARLLGARVGDGALDDLLDDGRPGFARELEQLQRLAGLTASNEVDDHTSLT